jgi:hypothetical protein
MLGCRVAQQAADQFNRSAPRRWRDLHRRAYQDTIRKVGPQSVQLTQQTRRLPLSSSLALGQVHAATMGTCDAAPHLAAASRADVTVVQNRAIAWARVGWRIRDWRH